MKPSEVCCRAFRIRGLAAALVVACLLSAASEARAQGPDAGWRTLATGHFRFHYPVEYETWTLRAAARADAIHDRLADVTGHAPGTVIDVVISDPFAAPNGFALPILTWPRIMLFTTPPAADSDLGRYTDWSEVLLVHETAHVVHLTRPSRHPLGRVLERLWIPVGPLARHAPRWVIEGYATLLEGDLTGAGRPASDLRAAVLRRWAQQGRLPGYAQLSADSGHWRDLSMAYLAGSAYLEWLRERRGPDSFRDLWARMSARNTRSFDEAFSGVFGAGPAELYGRFVAELTARAMEVERIIEPARRDGELWQRLSRTTGVPAVSRDGTRLALVVRERDRPARLVVWSTGPDDEAGRRWQEQVDRMLERDPEDVAPARDAPPPRTPLHVLPTVDGIEPMWPRWMPDGESVLFVRFEPDAGGFLTPDLFRWDLGSGGTRRLTRGARLWHPDPAPDGRWAAAVRHRHGFSQLVQVSLDDGSVEAITPPSVDIVYDHPRVSPDGRRLAYLRLRDGTWRAVVRDLDSGQETEIDTPPAASLAHPAWSADGGTLHLSVGAAGFIDIQAFDLDARSGPRQLTRTHGAAFAPVPAADGRLFFLNLEPHGFDLRVIHDVTVEAAAVEEPIDRRFVPAVPPATPAATPWETRDEIPAWSYGMGRQEFLAIPGGRYSPSASAVELGLRGGDLLGRLSYLAIASMAPEGRGPRGLAAAGAWRGWPATVRVHAFRADEEPSRQPLPVPDAGTVLDARRSGVETAADWTRRLAAARAVRASGGLFVGSIDPADGTSMTARRLFAEAAYSAWPSRGELGWRYGAFGRIERGRTSRQDWHRTTIAVDGSVGVRGRSVSARWRRHATRGAPTVFDVMSLGGMASSILPASALHGRVLVPALPAGTRLGTDHESQRVEISPGGLPVFYERHRLWNEGAPRGEWLALVGIEARANLPPFPLVRLPAADLTAGVARLLDEPFRGRTRIWISVVWRP